MKSRIHYFFIALGFFLSAGCSYNATGTLYKTPDTISVKRMGFVDLSADSVAKESYNKVNEVYRTSFANLWSKLNKDSARYINKNLSFYYPDTIEIARLCSAHNTDGLILSSVKLVQTDIVYAGGILLFPVVVGPVTYHDAEVELKLFDRHGSLLISTSFFTGEAGKSAVKISEIDKVVNAGVEGALKGMIKEIHTTGYTFFDPPPAGGFFRNKKH